MGHFLQRILCFLLCIILFWASPQLSPTRASPPLPNLSITDIPNLRFRDFPPIQVTAELIENLQPVMPDRLTFDWTVGDRVKATDVLQIGNFQLLGLTDASIEDIARIAGSALNGQTIADFGELIGGLTPDNLMSISGLNIQETLLNDVPAIASLAAQVIGLGDIPAEVPDLSQLQQFISGLTDGSQGMAPSITSLTQLQELGSKITVGKFTELVPSFGQQAIASIGEKALAKAGNLQDAIPGMQQVALGNIPGSAHRSLSSLNRIGFENLSMAQFPAALSLARGIIVGVADVALGTPRSQDADREQQRRRIISGGIPNQNMVLVGGECGGDSCPHFEIAVTGNPEYHGAAWMDAGGQKVPDGFGVLCKPWDCKGVPGNHPFGPAVRVLLTEIDQAKATANIGISFPWCQKIPFEGLSCTPWIFPTAKGITLGQLSEELPVAFIPPGLRVNGEVTNNPFPNPHAPPMETSTLSAAAPAEPIPPPKPCPPGDRTCLLTHPLPRNSGVPLDGWGACRDGCGRLHKGVDFQSVKGFQNSYCFRMPCGEAIVAAADGVVSEITPVGGRCGGIIAIRHPDRGISTRYVHLIQINVSRGQQVTRGQQIGIEGDEQPRVCSFGAHLHYEIWAGGAPVNPRGYQHDPPIRARHR